MVKITVTEREFDMLLDMLEQAKTKKPNEKLAAAFANKENQSFIVREDSEIET